MRIKNKNIFIIFYILIFFIYNFNLQAEEFNISAKEVLIEKDKDILIGKGLVKAKDSQGRVIEANKIKCKTPNLIQYLG